MDTASPPMCPNGSLVIHVWIAIGSFHYIFFVFQTGIFANTGYIKSNSHRAEVNEPLNAASSNSNTLKTSFLSFNPRCSCRQQRSGDDHKMTFRVAATRCLVLNWLNWKWIDPNLRPTLSCIVLSVFLHLCFGFILFECVYGLTPTVMWKWQTAALFVKKQ